MTVSDSPKYRTLLNELVRGELGRLVREELLRRWPETAEELSASSRYALVPAGKMLRPLMALQAAQAVGGNPSEIVAAVLGLEYLHAATLVHDDIIDGDLTRRGRPSVPAAYGIPNAIVTGDNLIFSAFESIVDEPWVASPARVIAAVGELAETGRDLCRGQVLESQLVADLDAGAEWYAEMIRLKTGALFRAACYIGAILGGAGAAAGAGLAAYGENVGIAFQIRDDLLAYVATPEQTGKPGTSDLRNGRPTLPLIVAYQRAEDADRDELRAVLARRAARENDVDWVHGLVLSCDAVAGAHDVMAAHVERAIGELAVLTPSPSVAVLTDIARWTTSEPR
ncbi:polyprenyl synthetase family protein [Labedaea rhizosphaerae]|uniref:Geranylgeranyl diphosphate synthase type I n=1 Tax=Labedaea rhizosphaerae TaxID=598644 RepID=A0A4V3CY66_LABRH|nr:polyprenyl synthetase family protein [Labedaea rhizosphaerae]TDP92988.1 geranylgeranyl diphosphate synthase type I [Labedaea rhizosphaerae]